MRRSFVTCLTLVMTVAVLGSARTSVARAQDVDSVEAFRGRVDGACRQVDADVADAIGALDRLAVESIEARRSRALTEIERPTHTDLFLCRARAHLRLLNNEQVRESFREVLRIDPFFAGDLTPREKETIDELLTSEGGFIDIVSSEAGAAVLINGRGAGTAGTDPLRLTLLPGVYEIRLEKPGYTAAATRAMVSTGQVVAANLEVKLRVPPVVFLTDRAGVDVMIDNVSAGRTIPMTEVRKRASPEEAAALDRILVATGFDLATASAFIIREPPVDRALSVRFRGDCLVDETRSIAVTPEALASLGPTDPLLWFGAASAIRMQPHVGSLRVTSNPIDADVFLDGELVGRTPFERAICAGQHRIRLVHPIGTYNVTTMVVGGKAEVIDAALRPRLAFLGVVDTVGTTLNPSTALTSMLAAALGQQVKTYRVAESVDPPSGVARWSEESTAGLIAAFDRNDAADMTQRLEAANANFEASLILTGVRRPSTAGIESPVELLLFWREHTAVDRLPWLASSPENLTAVLSQLDAPADGASLSYDHDLGIRVVDTPIEDAALVVVAADTNSAAGSPGLAVGDVVEAVDGARVTAAELRNLVRQKAPGDTVTLRVSGRSGPARQITLAIQRRPRRAPIFDPNFLGNAMIAKLTAAVALTPKGPERDLRAFNLAWGYMRVGAWRKARELLTTLPEVPSGLGVGPGAALFLRARCEEELGARDQAILLYRDAQKTGDEAFGEDGVTVAALARRRLVLLGG